MQRETGGKTLSWILEGFAVLAEVYVPCLSIFSLAEIYL